jgi:rubrerythrin
MDLNSLLTALKNAMEAEMTGYQFYLHAAKTTKDSQGKATFSRMAKEEMDHFHALKSQYVAVLENGRFDRSTALLEVPSPQPASPIFSTGFREQIGQQHFEMSALSVGMQLELNAINHYRKSAEECDDADVKAFFLRLEEWEQGHYDGFADELEQLREDYWQANDFLPY